MPSVWIPKSRSMFINITILMDYFGCGHATKIRNFRNIMNIFSSMIYYIEFVQKIADLLAGFAITFRKIVGLHICAGKMKICRGRGKLGVMRVLSFTVALLSSAHRGSFAIFSPNTRIRTGFRNISYTKHREVIVVKSGLQNASAYVQLSAAEKAGEIKSSLPL